jgi:putative transposase
MTFNGDYRRGVLDADMLRCCEDAMRKVCGDFGAELREFNGKTITFTCLPGTRRWWPSRRW